MKGLRRVFISIIRRKKESILYFLITAVLMSLLCSSLLCYRASSSSVKAIKEELGSTITIKGDYASLLPKDWHLFQLASSYREISDESKRIVEVIKEYENDERIAYCDYSLVKLLTRDTFFIETFSGSQEIEISWEEYLESFNTVRELIKTPGKFTDHMAAYFCQNAYLYGVNTQYNDIFQSTADKFFYLKISKGRFFTPEEVQEGKHVCIIQRLSGYYDSNMVYHTFELGDQISVCNVTVNNDEEIVKTDVYSFEIVGFFSTYQSNDGESTILVPNKVIEEIQKTDEQISRENKYYILSDEWAGRSLRGIFEDLSIVMKQNTSNKMCYLSTPIIKVKDGKYIDEIINELKDKIPFKDIIISVNATEYEMVSGSIGMLESTSRMFTILCISVSIVVLSLVTIISVIRRRYEMGIYLALGEKRKSIIFRIIAEYMIIGVLCIAIALTAGSRIAGRIGEDVIKEYEKAHEEKLRFRDPQTMSIMEDFDIGLKKDDILSVTAIGGGIIAVTSLASALIILTFNPKKILLVE